MFHLVELTSSCFTRSIRTNHQCFHYFQCQYISDIFHVAMYLNYISLIVYLTLCCVHFVGVSHVGCRAPLHLCLMSLCFFLFFFPRLEKKTKKKLFSLRNDCASVCLHVDFCSCHFMMMMLNPVTCTVSISGSKRSWQRYQF